MPDLSTPEIFPKDRPSGGVAGRTLPVEWAVVVLGGVLVLGNVLELGGLEASAREWSAWLLAGLALTHGASLAWERGREDEAAGVRLPRWPLALGPLLAWMACGWWQNTLAPWVARDTFYLCAQAWLLGWMVATTPGGRTVSWAWLALAGAAGALAFGAALGWQHGANASWLPLNRSLPVEWAGRWTGTLPTPGAFGGLMVLSGTPLLVIAGSRRWPAPWRICCGCIGLMLFLGAVKSFSFGAWLGVALVVLLLPLVVGPSLRWQIAGWAVSMGGLMAVASWVLRTKMQVTSGGAWWSRLQAGEPGLDQVWLTLWHTLQANFWSGGGGRSFPDLSNAAGAQAHGGGWSYGLGDWTDLATVWGAGGAALGLAAWSGLLAAAWSSWARLPLAGAGMGGSPAAPNPRASTPETKVLLAAATLALSAFGLTMLGARTLNVPAVAYVLAVVAGVVARQVPQRGGSWRLEAHWRWLAGVGPALLVAAVLLWRVVPVAHANVKVEQAHRRLDPISANPRLATRSPELLAQATDELAEALKADPHSAPAWIAEAWLRLDQTYLDPVQFDALSQAAENDANQALELAPRAPAAHLALALACVLDNRLHQAAGEIRTALAQAPRDPAMQYYAIAVLALDPASRPAAVQQILAASQSNFPAEQIRHLEEAYTWASNSTVPLVGLRQHPLPPYYEAPAPWPPLHGLPAGAQATQPAAPTPP